MGLGPVRRFLRNLDRRIEADAEAACAETVHGCHRLQIPDAARRLDGDGIAHAGLDEGHVLQGGASRRPAGAGVHEGGLGLDAQFAAGPDLVLGEVVALQYDLDRPLASGFHHSHADHGEGFCTFNGLVVAAEALRAEGALARVAVLDLDLHYGNGTASLCAPRPWLFNCSLYGNDYCQNTPPDPGRTAECVRQRIDLIDRNLKLMAKQ